MVIMKVFSPDGFYKNPMAGVFWAFFSAIVFFGCLVVLELRDHIQQPLGELEVPSRKSMQGDSWTLRRAYMLTVCFCAPALTYVSSIVAGKRRLTRLIEPYESQEESSARPLDREFKEAS
jgi:hypothetical protein